MVLPEADLMFTVGLRKNAFALPFIAAAGRDDATVELQRIGGSPAASKPWLVSRRHCLPRCGLPRLGRLGRGPACLGSVRNFTHVCVSHDAQPSWQTRRKRSRPARERLFFTFWHLRLLSPRAAG